MKTKRPNRRRENKKTIRELVKTCLDSWSESSPAINKPAPLIKRWSIKEQEAILDYLHGDTPPDEVKACCYYEYARASEVFRKARREYKPSDFEGSKDRITWDFPLFRNDWRRLEIVICPGFPELPWPELSEMDRKKIADHFVKPRATPLLTDSFILNSLGIFDRFKQQAESTEYEWRKRPGGRGHYPAIVGVGDNAVKHVAVTLNYSEGKKAMKEKVSRWLDSPANRKLFGEYYKKPIHKQNPDSPDRYNELLKFLAAWRLYDELGFEGAAKWTMENRREHSDGPIRVRKFFREKRGARVLRRPLYKESRLWKEAIANAKRFLVTEIERGCGLT